MLYVLMKILWQASAKQRERKKGLRVLNLTLLLLVFKWHHGSEEVNVFRCVSEGDRMLPAKLG